MIFSLSAVQCELSRVSRRLSQTVVVTGGLWCAGDCNWNYNMVGR